MGCKMSRSAGVKGRRKANKKDALSESSTIRSVDMFPHVDELQTMKRAQLQKFCKKAGIKATGKVQCLRIQSNFCIAPYFIMHAAFY